MTITQKFENDLIKASEALEKQKEQGKNYFNIFPLCNSASRGLCDIILCWG